jgi:GYF domain 2
MARQWFYSHSGHTLGPVSARQLKYLAATGGLQPEDHIWAEGTDPKQATIAGTALDFANLRRLAQVVQRRGAVNKTRVAEDQLPDWLDEIDQLFRDPEQAWGPVPEWLQPEPAAAAAGLPEWVSELTTDTPQLPPPAEPPPPPAPEIKIAMPVTIPIGSSLLERMGIDPVTEQVVDWPKLKKWLAGRMRDAELAAPSESDPDPFQTARKQLATWFDQEKNLKRLAQGDTMAVREDPVLRDYLNHFARYGLDKQARLWEFVDFLIETRRRA